MLKRPPRRPPISVRLEIPASDLPPPELGNRANTTIGLSEELQRTLYKELELCGGDTVVLVAGDREITGTVLSKPTDCLLVVSDVEAVP